MQKKQRNGITPNTTTQLQHNGNEDCFFLLPEKKAFVVNDSLKS